MTIAQLYPFTVYATTPSGHRFAVASYPTRESADAGAVKHNAAHAEDTTEVRDYAHIPALGPRDGSWVVTRRETGEVIGEFFACDWRNVRRFSPATCVVETIGQYLGRINRQIAETH